MKSKNHICILVAVLAIVLGLFSGGCQNPHSSGRSALFGLVQESPNTVATQISWSDASGNKFRGYLPKEHDLEGLRYDPATGAFEIDRFLSQSERSTLAQGRREAELAAEHTGLAGEIIRSAMGRGGVVQTPMTQSTFEDPRITRIIERLADQGDAMNARLDSMAEELREAREELRRGQRGEPEGSEEAQGERPAPTPADPPLPVPTPEQRNDTSETSPGAEAEGGDGVTRAIEPQTPAEAPAPAAEREISDPGPPYRHPETGQFISREEWLETQGE